MRQTNIRKMDLNLLVALDVLLEELHISRSAERLNLSQPAMSRVLARLREMLDDPLLVRASDGYHLTPRAEALVDPVRSILNDIEQALAKPEFEPSEFAGEFSICTLDYGEVVVIPELMEVITAASQNISLRVVHRTTYSSTEVEDGQADVLLGILPKTPATSCETRHLFNDEYVCVMHRNHPLSSRKMTLEDFVEYPHSIIGNGSNSRTEVDDYLSRVGLNRRVTKVSPHFAASVLSMGDTNLLQTVPRLLAESAARTVDLVVREPPVDFGPIRIGMMWHSRNTSSLAHGWFRDQITAVSKRIETRIVHPARTGDSLPVLQDVHAGLKLN